MKLSPWMVRGVMCTALVGASSITGGCLLVGAVAESYRKDAKKQVHAESDVLSGKSFAVLVTADRGVQGDNPYLVDHLADKVVGRLATPTNVPAASGFIPAAQSLRYTYDNPAWTFQSKTDLAKELGGVQRLVVIEITEYRLNLPGNSYVWDGLAAGLVSVYDPNSSTPELAVFERSVTVKFPNEQGLTPENLSGQMVNSALALRFVDRATWPFYLHEEPFYPEY